MIIVPIPIIRSISGRINGLNSSTHVRTNARGTCFVCRNPQRTKPPTPSQLRSQQRMRQACASYQAIKDDPVRLAQYQEAFERQTRYVRLRDFIIHVLLSEH